MSEKSQLKRVKRLIRLNMNYIYNIKKIAVSLDTRSVILLNQVESLVKDLQKRGIKTQIILH